MLSVAGVSVFAVSFAGALLLQAAMLRIISATRTSAKIFFISFPPKFFGISMSSPDGSIVPFVFVSVNAENKTFCIFFVFPKNESLFLDNLHNTSHFS